jgi:RimJ/RimL family protein N-acetyltransferase
MRDMPRTRSPIIVLRPKILSAASSLAPDRSVEVLAPGVLRTGRMILRPLRDSDRFEFLRVLSISRDHLRPFAVLHRGNESNEQIFVRQLELCRAGDEKGTAWRRVAFLDSGHIAGCFNLTTITRGALPEADANWWVSADAAHQGLGTEGVHAMLTYALAPLPAGLGLVRVQAPIMPSNAACIRLASRVGLVRQPEARVSIRIGERWEFHEIHVTNSDWANQNPNTD